MDAWFCNTCNKINGLRDMNGNCEQPTKDSVCGGRVLYQELKKGNVHDIKKGEKKC